MPTISPAHHSKKVVAEITQRVADLERTQRTEDVDSFMALFDTDAVWVTGGGRRLVGRDAIATFTRGVLPGAFSDGGSVSYTVDHILFISDEVVLTGVSQEYFDAQGKPAGSGLPTYIWRRAGDTWLIVSGQNTGVPEEETH